MPHPAYSKTLFISELIESKVECLSSFTRASNPRNDGAFVFSVAYSKHATLEVYVVHTRVWGGREGGREGREEGRGGEEGRERGEGGEGGMGGFRERVCVCVCVCVRMCE